MNILLVEDDVELALSLSQRLRVEGHVVLHQADGAAGLEAARQGRYDVVILDRMLPGLDGLAVVRALRQSAIDTPVLFLTTKLGIDDRVEGLEAGADDYLVKPFAFEELAALFAILFPALTVALLAAVFWIVEDSQIRALSAANQADIAAVKNGWREEGPAEALEVVNQLLGSPQYPGSYPARAFIDVEEREPHERASNFHPRGHPSGSVKIERAREGYSILGEGALFGDGVYVFVGRDTRQIEATRVRILKAFAWADRNFKRPIRSSSAPLRFA